MDFIKETDRCITNAVSSTLTEKNVISKGRSHMLMTCWCAASVHAIVLFACTVVLMLWTVAGHCSEPNMQEIWLSDHLCKEVPSNCECEIFEVILLPVFTDYKKRENE